MNSFDVFVGEIYSINVTYYVLQLWPRASQTTVRTHDYDQLRALLNISNYPQNIIITVSIRQETSGSEYIATNGREQNQGFKIYVIRFSYH